MLVGVLSGQVADLDVDDARVRHLVVGVAAEDAPEVYRGPVEEVGALTAEGQRFDRAERIERLEHGIVPSQGLAPCAAVPDTSILIASTPLACTPMCRSVGSPVIAKSPV